MDPMIFFANYAIYCEKKKLLQIPFFSEKNQSKQSEVHENSPQLPTTWKST